MPSDRKALGPDNTPIEFEESTHRYFTTHSKDSETVYTSVTTLIKEFFAPFDQQAIAESTAKRTGKTVEAILAEWEAKRDYACNTGTRVHEVAEDTVLDRQIRNKPNDEHERLLMKQAWLAANKIKDSMKIFGVETIVFDLRTAIAGTIDLLAFDKQGNLWILDWKTNATIDTDDKYRKTGLAPIKHVHDCNFMHYALQLSVYHYLLHKRGYVPPTTKILHAIIHLTETEYTIMPTPDMSIEVRDMIIATHLDNVPF